MPCGGAAAAADFAAAAVAVAAAATTTVVVIVDVFCVVLFVCIALDFVALFFWRFFR
jgi:hypothetical protein